MGEKEDIIEGLKSFRKKISEEEGVEKVIFFGSRAKGKPGKYSDIDLLVVSKGFRNEKCCRGARLYEYWKMDYPVDFLCYTPEEFRRLSRGVSIVSEAVRNGIAI
jgi:predicted nucleotidyltransferase